MQKSPQDQLHLLKTGCLEIIPEAQLLAQLEKSVATQTPLNIKFGADPSRPDIHLGHTVVLNKLRIFQELGHHVQFIIGDFTAMIGDPTGRNKLRPQLNRDDVLAYAKTYQEQVFKILNPAQTTVFYNSEWLGKMGPEAVIGLAAQATVQQLLARDDFSKRYAAETPIFLHEFLYPLFQAQDSVYLKSDLEIGGSDQKFNLLLGRELQRAAGLAPQSVMIMPILEGLDGVQKMSKSADNYIGVTDLPKDIFGKIMSISDELMLRYYTLLSDQLDTQIAQLQADLISGAQHPMTVKKNLAEMLVARFYGADVGKAERDRFESVFSKGAISDDVATIDVPADENGQINVVEACLQAGFAESKNEIRRLMKQNAVKLNDQPVTQDCVGIANASSLLLKVGKLRRVFLRVIHTSKV